MARLRHLSRAIALACVGALALALPAGADAAIASGTALRGEDSATPWQGCDGLTPNVQLSVAGGVPVATSCNVLTDAFSFTGVTMPGAGALLITSFSTSLGEGVNYYAVAAGGADVTDISLVQNRVTVDSTTSPRTVTRAQIAIWDGPNTGGDIPIDASNGTLEADPNIELHITSGVRFDTQGTVEIGSIHVDAGATLRTSTGWDWTVITGTGTSDDCNRGPGFSAPVCVEPTGIVDAARVQRFDFQPASNARVAISADFGYEEIDTAVNSDVILGTRPGQTLDVLYGMVARGKITTDPFRTNLDLGGFYIVDATLRIAGAMTMDLDVNLTGNGKVIAPGAAVRMHGKDPLNEIGPGYGNSDWRIGSLSMDTARTNHVYGTAGVVTYDSGGADTPVATVTDGSDRSYVLINRPGGGAFLDDWSILRYQQNGALDTTWGSGGELIINVTNTDVAAAMALTPAGDLLVAGSNDNMWTVRKYHPNGTPDTTFGTAGVWQPGILGTVRALTVVDAGHVFVAGDDTGGMWQIRRLSATGTVLTSLSWDGNTGSGAVPVTAAAMCVSEWDQGHVYVVGQAGSAGARDWAVGRMQDTGGGVWAWVPYIDAGQPRPSRINAGGTEDNATACAEILAGNRLYIGGTVGNGANDDMQVRSYEVNGQLTTWWATNGIDTYDSGGRDYLTKIFCEEPDMWIVGGDSTSGGRTVLRRLDGDGQKDTSWNNGAGVSTWDAGGGVERGVGADLYLGDYINILSSKNGPSGDVAMQRYDISGLLQDNAGGGVARISIRGEENRRMFVDGDVTVGTSSPSTKVMLDADVWDGGLDIGGALRVRSDGLLRATNRQVLRVGGDLDILGPFWNGGGTIQVWPKRDVVSVDVSPTTVFDKLDVKAGQGSALVRFDTVDAIRVTGAFTARGTDCTDTLRLRGIGGGWTLNNSGGTTTASYLDLAGVNAALAPITVQTSHDSLTNTGVTFGGVSCGTVTPQGPDTLRVNGAAHAINVVDSPAPTLQLTNHAGSATDRADVTVLSSPRDNTLGLWRFDGDGSDASGSGNALTPRPGIQPIYSAGTFGQGISFPSGSDGTDTPVVPVPTEFTVDGWVKRGALTGADAPYPLLVYRGNGASQVSYMIRFVRATNMLQASVSGDGGDQTFVETSAAPITDNQWHHVALTYYGHHLRLFVDGELQSATRAFWSNVDAGSWTTNFGSVSNASLDDWNLRSVAADLGMVRGYYRTGRPHADPVWTTTNAVTASTPDDATVTIPYGGTAGSLAREGARYWVTSRLQITGAGAWSTWSRPDWFETRVDYMTIGLPDGAAQSVGTLVPGTDGYADFGVEITTDSENGWTLAAHGESDAYALSSGLVGATNRISARSSPGTTSSWPVSTGGYAGLTVLAAPGGKNTSTWDVGTTGSSFGTLKYGWPTQTTPLTLHTYGLRNPSTQRVDLSARVNPGATTRPGSYSATIELTAVPNL